MVYVVGLFGLLLHSVGVIQQYANGFGVQGCYRANNPVSVIRMQAFERYPTIPACEFTDPEMMAYELPKVDPPQLNQFIQQFAKDIALAANIHL
jgi:hypothetical protein